MPVEVGAQGLWRFLNELHAPLLVIHGALDPVVAYAHGIALSRAVPGAKLVTLEEAGHELHEADWPTLSEALVAHTGAAR